MENRWSDADAREYVARYGERHGHDVALRVYTSRLIGADPALVLHGGGNTSVKTEARDELGAPVHVLCVKGSGWDLGDLEPAGLPALRLAPLQELRALDVLSDEAMVNALRTRMLDASGPNPSVETLLHAFLPHRFIDHSHADAILSVVDQPESVSLCRELYGERFAIVPYVMPGFALAKLAAQLYERSPTIHGLLLLQHGLFTFGDSAEESYVRHVQAVDLAEQFAKKQRYWSARTSVPPPAPIGYAELAPVLRGCLGEGRRRYVLHHRTNPVIQEFVDDAALGSLSQVGPATPDHVIRTKRLPLVLDLKAEHRGHLLEGYLEEQLDSYRKDYRAYVQRQVQRKTATITPLDPDPRVVLIPGIGVIGVGATEGAARIAADLYEHTIQVIRDANAIGRYQALGEDDLFDMEYWSLEQAKLGKKSGKPLEGHVVYVSGAASGIGAAIAVRFAAAGANLYLVDRSAEPLAALAGQLDCAYRVIDVGDEAKVRASIDEVLEIHGGLDGVISNAGTAPQGPIDSVSTADFEASMRVNLYAHQWLASAASRAMKRQGLGGYLLFNASKAAFNPGAGFGPYAIPKAALIALMKQYALEGGEHGIRSNAINADRVRTGLLDERQVAERARARGLDTDAYYRANLLQREVSPEDVAEAFLTLALAQSTTGSVLTVDGGNIAASPR